MNTVTQSLQYADPVLSYRAYAGLFVLLLVMYIPGLFVPLMDNDSAHHANIALQMYLDGNYTQLIDQGKPYLDKPHLLFWTAALSYHLFGVTTFAYKLPSLLFTVLGTYSTFRLGELLYNKDTGRLAALIVATSFAYILATNDVRMDAMLTASIIFALWQLCAYTFTKHLLHLVIAAFGLALGFATKGMIGVAISAVALLLYLLYERNWRMLFHWQWLLLIVLFFAFISPVLYAYYLQFDLHPELEVRGRNQLSGVRFILWEQNFERMQGEAFGAKGDTKYAYYLHTYLWAFLPWSMLGAIALFARIGQLAGTRLRYQPGLELLTTGSIVFFVCLFSLSKFKLPHYLNVLFPLFALLLANYLYQNRNKIRLLKIYWNIQVFVLSVMVLASLLLNVWLFPMDQVWVMAIALVLFLGWLQIGFSKKALYKKTVYWSVFGTVFVMFLLHANFYPKLLSYQAGNTLAAIGKAHGVDHTQVYTYQVGHSFSYDFYTAHIHSDIGMESIQNRQNRQQPFWVITDDAGRAQLQENGMLIRRQYGTQDFHVSRLKWKFLNPRTRPDATAPMYLLEL